MLQKWLMLTLSSTLLFTMPIKSDVISFHPTMQIAEDKANLNGMIQKDRFGLIINPIQIRFEKDKIELEKKKAEEQKINDLKKVKEDNIEWQEFIVSFYTGLEEENSIHGNVDCKGRPLERGVIANNILPLGTKIFLEKDYGIRTVSDKGGSNFNSSNHIDMYVERWDGETREQWKKRANSYGVKKLRGYIVK